MIGVTGATGTIGSALLDQLRSGSSPVRAYSRRPEAADGGGRVDWMRADLAEPYSLLRAFGAGERLVKLSALGSTDRSLSVIGLWHYNVERELKESGLEWTILRPHHFMQNMLDATLFDRNTGRVYSAAGEGRIPFVDTRDVAAEFDGA